MSRPSGFDSAQGGALLRAMRMGHAPNSAIEITRARRAVALQTERGLPVEEVREILAMLGIDRAPEG